ncbi:2-oxoglutarate-dependent dioxygenase htyE [Pseudocercospora fuligena]|uniref:2-oxoglutarate-dependent dioxygenase htyE n=1 Tax=Pseudocercospora fuligena TaxID=685502 RepID=A0A8H6RMQ1_9PEZI|nr:2-oxoglutarate-dependent dioxygenase htyE [Pseudocercospora fuligena]
MGSLGDHPKSVAENTSIPIIDFSKWYNSSSASRKEVAAQLISAGKEYGFVYIVNHGVKQSSLDQAFAITKALFDLPMEDKMKAPHPDGPDVHRGYSHPGLELVTDYLGSDQDVGARERPSGWLPESTLPGFRKITTDFYWECHAISLEILKCIGVGLSLDEDSSARFHCGRYNQLRLLHYPPVPAEELESGRTARNPAHTDWGSITMLFQDECGGLEVEHPKKPGTFMPVNPVEGACVMNIGDMLMRWSNDLLKSSRHRVRQPPRDDRYTGPARMTRARYSIPYFIVTDPDTLIECLPTCVDEEHPARYEPVVQEDWARLRRGIQYPTAKAKMEFDNVTGAPQAMVAEVH